MTPVELAGMTTRLYNILKHGGIETLEQAATTLNHVSFMKLRGAGRKSRQELNSILESYELPRLVKYCHTCHQPLKEEKKQ